MDAFKTYRVVPVVEPGQPAQAAISFEASGDFDALAHAHRLLGLIAPFDLYQVDRLVLKYRPRETPRPRR